jgi:hypothetical protein
MVFENKIPCSATGPTIEFKCKYKYKFEEEKNCKTNTNRI